MGIDPATRGILYGLGLIVMLMIVLMGGWWFKNMDKKSRRPK